MFQGQKENYLGNLFNFFGCVLLLRQAGKFHWPALHLKTTTPDLFSVCLSVTRPDLGIDILKPKKYRWVLKVLNNLKMTCIFIVYFS